ncbi:MBL fold metallo-hydrolase [Pseudomonas guariconensis]|uniref:hypothetical protein n=1 Tax=Pseudomonas guariconensis TaxID=1288410 RepID=UPI00384EFBFC
MALKIHPINLGNMQMDSSGLVMFRNPGEQVTIPVLGFLITGGEEPILVDTGSRNAQQYEEYGLTYEVTPQMTLEYHLAHAGREKSTEEGTLRQQIFTAKS